MGKKPSRRRVSCGRKRRFTTEEAAAEEAAQLNLDQNTERAHRWPVGPYGCVYCDGWHVGHVPFDVLRTLKSFEEIELIFRHNPKPERVTVRQCEVIVCGKAGPHQCNHTATRVNKLDRFVCHHHQNEAAQYRVFTAAEAVTLYRARRRRGEERRSANRKG